jgi:hypothetical protein
MLKLARFLDKKQSGWGKIPAELYMLDEENYLSIIARYKPE